MIIPITTMGKSSFGKRPHEYIDFKNSKHLFLTSFIDNSRNKGKIDFIEASTPLTNEHFTSPYGSIYGIKHSMLRCVPIRARTKLPNFIIQGNLLFSRL